MLPLLAEAHPGVWNAGATNSSVASLLNIRHFAEDAAGIPRMTSLFQIAGCLHI